MERPQQQCRSLFGDQMIRSAFVVIALLPALALAQTATCPTAIPAGSIQIVRPPGGWLATSPSLVRLNAAGMLSGEPKQMQYLVPNDTKKHKGGSTSTWAFDAGEQKWFYCSYGATQLSKRMDDKATVCDVTGKLDRTGAVDDIAVVCR